MKYMYMDEILPEWGRVGVQGHVLATPAVIAKYKQKLFVSNLCPICD